MSYDILAIGYLIVSIVLPCGMAWRLSSPNYYGRERRKNVIHDRFHGRETPANKGRKENRKCITLLDTLHRI